MKVISYFFIVLILIACKKEAGPGGKNAITGSILYKNGATGNNDAAATATVFIAYGTSEATSVFNQTLLSDVNGKYIIEGLNKGNYFIKAESVDEHGFRYSAQGVGVTLRNKKSKVEVNIVLE